MNVVRDVNEIVNSTSGTDYGVPPGPTVNARVGSDVDIVADHNLVRVRLHLPLAARIPRVTEAVLSDQRSRSDDDLRTDLYVATYGSRVMNPRHVTVLKVT